MKHSSAIGVLTVLLGAIVALAQDAPAQPQPGQTRQAGAIRTSFRPAPRLICARPTRRRCLTTSSPRRRQCRDRNSATFRAWR